MTMTNLERTLVRLMCDVTRDGIVASVLGPYVFGTERNGRVASVNGGGDYAMQMLLGRMRKRGLVRVLPGPGASRWTLTAAGTQLAVRTLQDHNIQLVPGKYGALMPNRDLR